MYFDRDALKILWSYFSNRWQMINIDTVFSSCKEILKGVQQGSVFASVPFKIFWNDPFFLLKEETGILSYADTTPCDVNLYSWSEFPQLNLHVIKILINS